MESSSSISSSSIRRYSSSSVFTGFSSSSATVISEDKSLARSAMLILNLIYYEEYGTHDGLNTYADPRIYFYVETYSQSMLVAKDTTRLMLSRNDIQVWSGSVADTLYIEAGVDSLVIIPKVFDSDLLINDDISPGYKHSWYRLSNLLIYMQEQSVIGKDTRVDYRYILSYLYY
jgi:hypothetical protein